MVKLYGPMMSLDARGTLADAITFSAWKGRSYARQRVIPSNPRSGPQTGMRSMFAFLTIDWVNRTAVEQATWDDRAKAANISNFNAYCGYNQDRWRRFHFPSTEDPATETGTAPGAPTVVATGGIHQCKLQITDGTPAPDYEYAIFRDTEASLTPGYDNCVAVVAWDTGGVTTYIDAPLTPGTYYYVVIGGLTTGLEGAPSTEVSGTVT